MFEILHIQNMFMSLNYTMWQCCKSEQYCQLMAEERAQAQVRLMSGTNPEKRQKV